MAITCSACGEGQKGMEGRSKGKGEGCEILKVLISCQNYAYNLFNERE